MPEKQIAIVTGASSGLGREFVKILAADDGLDEIWSIARREGGLSLLKQGFGEKIRTFSVDLADKQATLAFSEHIRKEQPNIRYLVNSAGFAKFGSYLDVSLEESLNMIDLNASGMVAMGLICLPYMQRGGHILNISSQSAFQPLPYLNLYSATKAFIRNYSRALHVELRDRGISVTAVCPGWMDTDLIDRAQTGAQRTVRRFTGMVSPDVVAQKALRDAQRGKDMSVYGAMIKLAHLVAKVLPQRAMMRIWLWQQGISLK